MKKKLPSKLTDKEIEVLVDHVLSDMSYRSGGTFHKYEDGEDLFDDKEAKKVLKALSKIVGFNLDEVKHLG